MWGCWISGGPERNFGLRARLTLLFVKKIKKDVTYDGVNKIMILSDCRRLYIDLVMRASLGQEYWFSMLRDYVDTSNTYRYRAIATTRLLETPQHIFNTDGLYSVPHRICAKIQSNNYIFFKFFQYVHWFFIRY